MIGAPDELRGEIVKAFIVLDAGYTPSEALIHDIQRHVKVRLAAHGHLRQIEFVDALPTTVTGRVMRRELRARSKS